MKWRQLNFLNFNKKGDNTSGVTTDAISCKKTLRTKKTYGVLHWVPHLENIHGSEEMVSDTMSAFFN